MSKTFDSLMELQELDLEIAAVRERLESYEPLLEEVDAPTREMASEVEATGARLQEMRLEERRLERSADEKRQRLSNLQDRLKQVRNVREEAAVQAEIDMVRRAVETDEQEALELLDEIRKTEFRLEEVEEKLENARAEVEPRRREYLEKQEEAEEELAILEGKRDNRVVRLSESARGLYERIREARTGIAITTLTKDGACGHCFSVIPLQKQSEIKRGGGLVRCEACGVILAPPDDD